jgi:hypothetical protein
MAKNTAKNIDEAVMSVRRLFRQMLRQAMLTILFMISVLSVS